jgi:hypothetical protein
MIIFRYPTSNACSIGSGLTGATYTSSGYKYTAITAGTGNVSFS